MSAATATATMRAIQLVGWEQPAVLRRVPVPEPGPGEVLLEVRAAGLCHSDLHLMEWAAGTLPYELPFTLGHEVAGVVAALGAVPRVSTSASPWSSTGRGGVAPVRPAAAARSTSAGAAGAAPAAAASAATVAWPTTSSSPPPACSCRSASSTRSARRRSRTLR